MSIAPELTGTPPPQACSPCQTRLISELNDTVRKRLPLTDESSRLIITDSVAALGIERLTELLLNVRDYGDFHDGNDPYGERDFGTVELGDERFFWKIDYFDRFLQYASLDPTQSSKTIRVLTVMASDEY